MHRKEPIESRSIVREGRSSARWSALAILLIITICVGVYARSLSFGYTNHDDDVLVKNSMSFLSDVRNIPVAFVTDAWYSVKEIELYRPLQSASLIVDAQLDSDVVKAAHRTNLILHILVCICAFGLLQMLGVDRLVSLFGALIYAAHFLLLHAVYWIPARGDLLLALFALLTVMSYVKIEQGASLLLMLGANVMCFALALLSKESAVMIPMILLAYKILLASDRTIRPHHWLLAALYGAAYMGFSVLRSQSVLASTQALSVGNFLQNLRTVPETLVKFFVPVNFSTMPFFDTTTSIVGVVLLLGVAILWYSFRASMPRLVVLGLAWFVLFMLPGMVYRPVFSDFTYEYLDHRAYLPFFGLIASTCIVVQHIDFSRRSLALIGGAVVVYLAGLNLALGDMYRDPFSFSQRAVETSPRSSLAHFIRGVELFKRGDSARALNDFSQALSGYPGFHQARFNRAALYFSLRRYQEAKADLDTLFMTKPVFSEREHRLRAQAAVQTRDARTAIASLEQVLAINPGDQQVADELAKLRQIQAASSIDSTQSSLGLRLNEQGVRAARAGQIRRARDLFQQAVLADPSNHSAIFNLANCMHALGDLQGACTQWRSAAGMGNAEAAQMVDKFCK
ncbi:MAG: tetratricopeptide repeat protein [Candidatus Kapabacteria bacterium]|nr:tetratricopeptide repeat protein [Candidatus Kapabacteria bacterium]